MKDFYQILDLPQDASQKQIKDRYRQLVRIFHPDRYPKPEDKRYAEQKLQEINKAYEALSLTSGAESRGLRLATDRRPPIPVVYPQQVDLGSVVYGERAYALFQIDNVGGFAQSLSFHVEDGVDWFVITKGERLDPHQPLPMLLHVEARTASLHVGQEVENWLDIDVNGVRARATLRMRVVNQPPAAVRPGWTVAAIGMVAVLLVVIYAMWNLLGSASADSTAVTQATPSLEPTSGSIAGLPVAVLPPAAVAIETKATGTAGETAMETATEGDTDPAPTVDQTLDIHESNTGVLQPLNQMPSGEKDPPTDLGDAPASLREVKSVDAEATATATIDPAVQNDSAPNDRISFVSKKNAGSTIEPDTAGESSSPPVPSTSSPVPVMTVPSTPLPTKTAPAVVTTAVTAAATTEVTTEVISVTTASPAPSIRPVTISVPNAYQINARASTTIESESLVLLDKGATFPAIARTIDNAWTQIVLPDGRTGWVFTSSMVADLTRIETLPVSVELLDVDSN